MGEALERMERREVFGKILMPQSAIRSTIAATKAGLIPTTIRTSSCRARRKRW